MADITLKNLGDIPVVEPNDSTHLLAEQDGAYARVPKDKVGVTSWNELEDKPFYEETGRGVLYDKTVTDDSYNQYLETNAPFAFVEGETYEVAVSNRSDDGEDITVEFVATSDADGFVGYEDETLTIRTKSADGVNALICILTGVRQKTYNIKIIGPGTFVRQLDPKFIPSGAGGNFIVNLTSSDGQTFSADKTFEEVEAAIDAGSVAYVRFTMPISNAFYEYTLRSTYRRKGNMVYFGGIIPTADCEYYLFGYNVNVGITFEVRKLAIAE